MGYDKKLRIDIIAGYFLDVVLWLLFGLTIALLVAMPE